VKFLPLDHGEPTRMAYMDFPAEGPAARNRTVMLLHGKNFDSSYWSDVIAFLRRAGFRVIVPDQIGFNKSSKPIRTYSFADLVANTLALADGLGLRAFDVIGHSTGGMLAVHLAAKHPARVKKLVLEDPIGLIDYRDHVPPPTLGGLEKAEAAHDAASYRAFIARYFVSLPAARYEPFVASRMRLALSGDYPRYLRVVALTYLMIYNEPVRRLYGALKCPVMLMAGEKDTTTPFLGLASPRPRRRRRCRRCSRRRATWRRTMPAFATSSFRAWGMCRISRFSRISSGRFWGFWGGERDARRRGEGLGAAAQGAGNARFGNGACHRQCALARVQFRLVAQNSDPFAPKSASSTGAGVVSAQSDPPVVWRRYFFADARWSRARRSSGI
jgi:pimeloyl-ACP methyl ester carboxylesterase